MSDQKICPTCGTEYPLSERFCPRDGTALRSANAQADLLGSVVADRYHILKKLGEGGMGTVYLAEHVKMGRKSALKVMNPGMNTDPDAIARFNREASNASRLSHPNICGIYDFGETPDGLIYLAMEFIEGSSLTSLIEKGGQLPAPRAASIVHQTADALQVAHDAGIVHRDLKPDNIMVARNRDGSDLVKVVDFGIAKASSSDAQKVTKTGLVVGTPEYMSPEQLAGDKLDGRSDIYSLGLVAFNCLTGTLPFASESAQEAMIMRLTDRPRSLAEVRPDVAWPAALQATMDKALARDAAERYQSAAQFGREFAAAVADMPLTKAVDAATAVMGAVTAKPAPAAVPPTRVNEARPSAKTVAMDVPEVAKKPAARAAAPAAAAAPAKAGLPAAVKFGGPFVAILASGVAIWISTRPDPTPSEPVNAPATQTEPGAAQVDPAATKADPAATQQPEVKPLSAPLGTKSAPTPTKTVGTETAEAPPAMGVLLRGWMRELDSGLPDSTEGARVYREVNAQFDKFVGEEVADAWYVRMNALASMNDDRACNAADEVKRRSSDPTKRAKADEIKKYC